MKNFIIYLCTLLIFIVSFAFSRCGLYIVSGLIVILFSIALYIYYYFISAHNLIDMRALFCLAWIGGMGVSCLKLSSLQKDWQILTWFCFYLAYLFFILSYEYSSKLIAFIFSKLNVKVNKTPTIYSKSSYEKGLMFCIRVVTVLTLAAFIFEAIILGYIPSFSSDPEAYSLFHITGVHYFTVSSMLILPLNVIYFGLFKPRNKRKFAELLLYSIISVAISVLIVSRALLMMTVLISFICSISLFKRIKLRYILAGGVGLVGLYIIITISRNHGIDYLNSIYHMKRDTPIFFSQPYIYIANNYDNFNELVKNLSQHSYGIKSLAPVYSLTGLKFFINIPNYPIYTTITELNTSTYLHDVFYDFGVAGVIGLSIVFGFVCSRVRTLGTQIYNPIRYVTEGLFSFILLFTFFNPWLSNTTIWFYFIALIAMFITVNWFAKHLSEK